jgi:hypothetical protein
MVNIKSWKLFRLGRVKLSAGMLRPEGQIQALNTIPKDSSPHNTAYERYYIKFDKRYVELAVIVLLAPIIFGLLLFPSQYGMTWEEFEGWLLSILRNYRHWAKERSEGWSPEAASQKEGSYLKRYKELLTSLNKADYLVNPAPNTGEETNAED